MNKNGDEEEGGKDDKHGGKDREERGGEKKMIRWTQRAR